MARIRNHMRRDLPPNLYDRNNGYYCYRDPRTGKEFGLGRNKRDAINQAIEANLQLMDAAPRLVDRINAKECLSFHAWLDRYDAIVERRGLKESTMVNHRSKLGIYRDYFPDKPIAEFTTKDIAEFVNHYVEQGKSSSAKIMRGTLLDIFREAIADGAIQHNPVEATRNPKTDVRRSRLSIADFNAIRQCASALPSWFIPALNMALVTGQRMGDVCSMKWEDISNGRLLVKQGKTGSMVAIPMRLSVADVNLEQLIGDITKTSDYIISPRTGGKVAERTMSDYFTKSRKLSGLSWAGDPPSFHEIRSLSARLHTELRGSEFAQRLLGHKSAEMTARYQDARGSEWMELPL
ncbi:phage integrase Arm DNA-binding domain-containing protein [Serratia fonticola]|uniref:Phage integrase Arm DNA-binding domain-containing protein n=1 Tax=Serratia fonticola TaxID=47917 RepID=A0AAJ2DCH4_SERFO|nr:phage integrase Arm DNA-binding domain-containing protein [Serratia fonticola]MDQ9128771.1 phage integrase Arm DNA-binding domain-containing protein [Serratia fonticola]